MTEEIHMHKSIYRGFRTGHTLRHRSDAHRFAMRAPRQTSYQVSLNRFLRVTIAMPAGLTCRAMYHRLLVDNGPGSSCSMHLKRDNRHRAKRYSQSGHKRKTAPQDFRIC